MIKIDNKTDLQLKRYWKQGLTPVEIMNLSGLTSNEFSQWRKEKIANGEIEPRPKGRKKGGHNWNYEPNKPKKNYSKYVKKGNWGGHLRKYTEEERLQIIHDYTVENMPIKEICDKFNIKYQTLHNILNNALKKGEKRYNKLIEINGEQKTINEWCSHLGVLKITVYKRMEKGMTIEQALTFKRKKEQ